MNKEEIFCKDIDLENGKSTFYTLERFSKATRIWKTIYTEEGGYVDQDIIVAIYKDGGMFISDNERSESITISKELSALMLNALKGYTV